MQCEEAQERCPYPTQFSLKQSSKGEDRLTVSVRTGSDDSLWAVFDGHRSHDVAGYAARTLPSRVWQSEHWPGAPGEALREALCLTHEAARKEDLYGGSTAVVCAAMGDVLYCASAGDSRAVVGLVNGGEHRLSVHHSPRSEEELRRIQSSGGNVDFGDVDGLPMSRGIGNFKSEAAGFACLPDIREINKSEVDFLVVASDGLDVLDDYTVCSFVREHRYTGDANHVADALINRARELKSSDDIAVIVVFLSAQQAMDVSPTPAPRNLFTNGITALGPIPDGADMLRDMEPEPDSEDLSFMGALSDFHFSSHWRPPAAAMNFEPFFEFPARAPEVPRVS